MVLPFDGFCPAALFGIAQRIREGQRRGGGLGGVSRARLAAMVASSRQHSSPFLTQQDCWLMRTGAVHRCSQKMTIRTRRVAGVVAASSSLFFPNSLVHPPFLLSARSRRTAPARASAFRPLPPGSWMLGVECWMFTSLRVQPLCRHPSPSSPMAHPLTQGHRPRRPPGRARRGCLPTRPALLARLRRSRLPPDLCARGPDCPSGTRSTPLGSPPVRRAAA